LADMIKGYGIIPLTIPSPCHLHNIPLPPLLAYQLLG